jgi:hypothetical protein
MKDSAKNNLDQQLLILIGIILFNIEVMIYCLIIGTVEYYGITLVIFVFIIHYLLYYQSFILDFDFVDLGWMENENYLKRNRRLMNKKNRF